MAKKLWLVVGIVGLCPAMVNEYDIKKHLTQLSSYLFESHDNNKDTTSYAFLDEKTSFTMPSLWKPLITQSTEPIRLQIDKAPSGTPKKAAALQQKEKTELKTTRTNALKETLPPGPIGIYLDIYCNEEKGPISFALHDEVQKLWVKEEVLMFCKIPSTDLRTQVYQNEIYYALDDIPDLVYEYNANKLSLKIHHSALLKTTKIDLNQPNRERIRPQFPGGYINYDVTFQYNNATPSQLAGLTDFVYFNRYGVGNSEFLLEKATNVGTITRLNTTWTLDKPEEMASFRLGDSVTGTAIWTRAVLFAGVQYATNFLTQPGFIPFPLPAFRGQAVVPSTVEFYLDNQLQTQQQLANGPFEIQGLPAMTGSGELVVQTKDILGRQTVAVLPFYVSQQFLRPGLTNFSYELGMIRQNFGINSNDYSNLLFVGTFQEGITESWTAGWHGEFQSSQQTLGINSGHILSHFLEIDWAGAVSQSEQGIGGLFLLGAQRRARNYSLGAQVILTSSEFQQLGLQEDTLPPKMIFQSSAGLSKEGWGGLSFSYTDRIGRTEPNIGIMTTSYSRTLYHKLTLLFNYLHQTGESKSNTWYLGLIWSPAPNYNAALTYENGDSFQDGLTFSFNKNLPTDNGYGYRLVGSTGRYPNAQVDFLAQNDHGLYRALYSHFADSDYYELDASGAIVHFAQQNIFTRPIYSSFVLVQVPEHENVRVYWSNQLIGRTNDEGFIFIPQTTPYVDNYISINPEDLNINTLIESDKMRTKPYFQAGEFLKFPIYRVRNITFNLQFNNEFIPPGATIVIDSEKHYSVGYEGKVFISQSQMNSILSGMVYWKDKQCHFSITIPSKEQIITNLGTVACNAN